MPSVCSAEISFKAFFFFFIQWLCFFFFRGWGGIKVIVWTNLLFNLLFILNERPVLFLFLLPTNTLLLQPQMVPFLASDLSDIVRRSQIGITLSHAYCIKRYYSAWVHCHCWRRKVLSCLDKHEHAGKTQRYLNTQQHPRNGYSTWGALGLNIIRRKIWKHIFFFIITII